MRMSQGGTTTADMGMLLLRKAVAEYAHADSCQRAAAGRSDAHLLLNHKNRGDVDACTETWRCWEQRAADRAVENEPYVESWRGALGAH